MKTGTSPGMRHRCGICFVPHPSYSRAEACCVSHFDGATADQIEQVRVNRRKAIAVAAEARCPVWFVRAMAGVKSP